MTDNDAVDPYRPPEAPLELPESAPGDGPPANVKRTFVLLWITAFTSLAMVVSIWFTVGSNNNPLLDVATAAFSFLLMIFLAFKIRDGRNWARWTLAVLWSFGIISIFSIFAFMPAAAGRYPWPFWLASLFRNALELAAIILSFSKGASWWFHWRERP